MPLKLPQTRLAPKAMLTRSPFSLEQTVSFSSHSYLYIKQNKSLVQSKTAQFLSTTYINTAAQLLHPQNTSAVSKTKLISLHISLPAFHLPPLHIMTEETHKLSG